MPCPWCSSKSDVLGVSRVHELAPGAPEPEETDAFCEAFGFHLPEGALEVACVTCGERWVVLRTGDGYVGCERWGGEPPPFEGVWTTSAHSPDGDSETRTRLVLARDGDRLSGALELHGRSDAAGGEWVVERRALDGRSLGAYARLEASGPGVHLEPGGPWTTFYAKPVATRTYGRADERLLVTADEARIRVNGSHDGWHRET